MTTPPTTMARAVTMAVAHRPDAEDDGDGGFCVQSIAYVPDPTSWLSCLPGGTYHDHGWKPSLMASTLPLVLDHGWKPSQLSGQCAASRRFAPPWAPCVTRRHDRWRSPLAGSLRAPTPLLALGGRRGGGVEVCIVGVCVVWVEVR